MTKQPSHESRHPDEIESDIEQTRSRLDDTLNQLERKFSPQQWMNDTYDYVRHGGANDFVTNLGETVKQNPMPVVLASVGLGWLMLSSSQRKNRHDDRYDDHYDYPALPTTTTPSPNRAMATPTAGAPAAGSQDSEHGRMGDAKDKARHMASSARARGTHAKESSRAAMSNLSHRAQGAGSEASHFVQEHPLVAGALGIALGAALGGLLPSTRTEDEYLGETRDKALDKVATAGQQQANKAQAKIQKKGEQARSSTASEHTSTSDPTSHATSSGTSGQTSSSATSGSASRTTSLDKPPSSFGVDTPPINPRTDDTPTRGD